MRFVGVLVFVAGLTLTFGGGPELLDGSDKKLEFGQLAQALGFRCSTSVGVCPIPPAPIGAQCFCGSVPGTVVP